MVTDEDEDAVAVQTKGSAVLELQTSLLQLLEGVGGGLIVVLCTNAIIYAQYKEIKAMIIMN